MPKTEIKKVVKEYLKRLSENNFSYSSVYLFGSCNKGNSSVHSDIDIAVISKLENIDKNRLILWKIRREVDCRIEPHFFTLTDFNDPNNIMAFEIKKTGLKIQ